MADTAVDPAEAAFTATLTKCVEAVVGNAVPKDMMEYIAATVAEEVLGSESRSLRDPTLVEALADMLKVTLDDDVLEDRGGAEVLATDIITTAQDRDVEAPPEPAPLGMGEPTVGARCIAVLSEDDEWHPAVVTDVLGDDSFQVTFTEYSKPQTVSKAQLVLEENIADDDSRRDACPMCDRIMPLTRHHLIPRMMHEKYLKLGNTQEFLNTCLDICRQCHSAVHRAEPEAVLASDYHTLELLLTHPRVQKWITYARKLPELGVSRAKGVPTELLRHVQKKR
jgi:hypothetical protein